MTDRGTVEARDATEAWTVKLSLSSRFLDLFSLQDSLVVDCPDVVVVVVVVVPCSELLFVFVFVLLFFLDRFFLLLLLCMDETDADSPLPAGLLRGRTSCASSIYTLL
jgi:hypothetical protein